MQVHSMITLGSIKQQDIFMQQDWELNECQLVRMEIFYSDTKTCSNSFILEIHDSTAQTSNKAFKTQLGNVPIQARISDKEPSTLRVVMVFSPVCASIVTTVLCIDIVWRGAVR